MGCTTSTMACLRAAACCPSHKASTDRHRDMHDIAGNGHDTSSSSPLSTSSSSSSVSSSSSSQTYEPRSPKPPFHSRYDMTHGPLGAGATASVHRAIHRETGVAVAVKCFVKAHMQLDGVADLFREVNVLQTLAHPAIVAFVDLFDEPDVYFLVLELVDGGDLFDRLALKKVYSERDAQCLVRALLEVVQYLHQLNIVHQDLKPENILLVTSDDDTSIKLCDFGFAQYDTDIQLSRKCGTTDYMAPEVLAQPTHGREADIWSIGVITYILLCGYAPFHGKTRAAIEAAIQNGAFEFHAEYWDDASPAARSFVRRMLVTDPYERATVDELLADTWLARPASSVSFQTTIPQLRRFNARRKFKSAVAAVAATVAFRAAGRSRGMSALEDLSEATIVEETTNHTELRADQMNQ
ncbi:Aste57867_17170 [Aphanomyces stellatus]|uniref:Aste57867_17170 protein n=1 Tax=Aphanomyces stellatus TaxID=120398 RepID=A0A485L7G4_9STRA|nr:hypothetical protein As57867_017111 [Aphanomyces stellatus]VFT93927.1 Aste57867_17170 [Aphanomyces stellatus]